jgi:hypothetical protein
MCSIVMSVGPPSTGNDLVFKILSTTPPSPNQALAAMTKSPLPTLRIVRVMGWVVNCILFAMILVGFLHLVRTH